MNIFFVLFVVLLIGFNAILFDLEEQLGGRRIIDAYVILFFKIVKM